MSVFENIGGYVCFWDWHKFNMCIYSFDKLTASIAQLGERKTEDLEAPCSIHGRSSMN